MSDTGAARVTLITGGAGGIGSALARQLVADGGRVVVADVRVDDGRRLAGELGELAAFVDLDVADAASWSAAVRAGTDAFGRLDGLVNNAGIVGPGPLVDLDPATFDRVVAVNLRGCFLGLQAVAGPMASAGGGSIVNVASAVALAGSPGLSAYGASKWAIRGLTQTAAVELGPQGIRVNAVLPGSIATDLTIGAGPDEDRDRYFAALPLGRQGQEADVVRAISFLLGAGSGYCTGTELVVDGGMTARHPLPPRS